VRAVPVEDKSAAVETVSREKATSDPGSVGAPMSGVVVEVRVKEGHEVKKGDIICGKYCVPYILCSTQIHMICSAKRYEDGERCFCAGVRTHKASCCERGRFVESR
jgi:hypothetical protein